VTHLKWEFARLSVVPSNYSVSGLLRFRFLERINLAYSLSGLLRFRFLERINLAY
jgi:hypothetical protein